ncbi:ubiquitin-conjugating enzyme E2 Z-like [Oppia nitens]|uniref:ubiquitin-conjugating enzyme E2 Z-like n=1 Tax=Oppia nitens TaxID=1686743 RepID=UPI0023DC29A3|nr:ubiquitin-conjugating enzyme E2 Z-like [Oppia nitens]
MISVTNNGSVAAGVHNTIITSTTAAAAVNSIGGTGGTHIKRIMKDLQEFYRENSEDIYAVAEDNDLTRVHALIRGPQGTPYEKGFFYFVLKFPTNYPLSPPSVKLMTTNAGTVRFNPNLYACGRVCLSILGTWTGPAWTPAQTLFTILLSIQSLMNDKPYHNEPGYELDEHYLMFGNNDGRNVPNSLLDPAVNSYNDIIGYETIRVAVVGMLDLNSVDARNMPVVLRNVMLAAFRSDYDYFERTVRSRSATMDGQRPSDPFGDCDRPQTFEYGKLSAQLAGLMTTYDSIANSLVSGEEVAAAAAMVTHNNTNLSVNLRDSQLAKPYFEMVDKILAPPPQIVSNIADNGGGGDDDDDQGWESEGNDDLIYEEDNDDDDDGAGVGDRDTLRDGMMDL